MRRQRRIHREDEYHPERMPFETFVNGDSNDFVQMERLPRNGIQPPHRYENTLEAKVEEGDTLQALSLRFHCTIADIKRLNKIDKDNEIHARKIIKIPVTMHSVLLGTSLPAVHKSGNSSPTRVNETDGDPNARNSLEDAQIILGEKLIVASVNAGGPDINDIILNSKVAANATIYTDKASISTTNGTSNDDTSPLLDDNFVSQPRAIRGPSLRTIEFSGSDCDLSWVCLFVGILAICFVIPLIYVIHLAEHPQHHNS